MPASIYMHIKDIFVSTRRLALQGNGTSAIFSKDKRVTTFDMHGEA
jgi:hypothetical protein